MAAQLREVDADIVGLQELRRWPSQGQWIARHARPGGANAYSLTTAWKGGWWKWAWEGIGTLSRIEVTGHARKGLGYDRVVQRTSIRLPGGTEVDVYNTHLHHPPGASRERAMQALRLLSWMARRRHVPRVLMGDLNGEYASPEIRALRDAGLRSVFGAANLDEPTYTFPAPSSRVWGNPGKAIDFILVSDDISVTAARVAFEATSADDERLSSSDHYGIVADLAIT